MPKKTILKLRPLLEKKGMSLRELARLSDCRHSTLSQWQTKGVKSLDLQLLANVYEALELTDLRDLIDVVDDDSEIEYK